MCGTASQTTARQEIEKIGVLRNRVVRA